VGGRAAGSGSRGRILVRLLYREGGWFLRYALTRDDEMASVPGGVVPGRRGWSRSAGAVGLAAKHPWSTATLAIEPTKNLISLKHMQRHALKKSALFRNFFSIGIMWGVSGGKRTGLASLVLTAVNRNHRWAVVAWSGKGRRGGSDVAQNGRFLWMGAFFSALRIVRICGAGPAATFAAGDFELMRMLHDE